MADDSANPDFRRKVPAGDDRERLVCETCGYVHYDNPRIVVGAVVTWKEAILLCRRAIAPRAGYWTLPAGFLEHGETAEEGTRREAWEEARADIAIEALLAVYSVSRIGQVQLFYKARLVSDDIAAGPESREVGLFDWADIPWGDLAFPTVRWALEHHRAVARHTSFSPFTNPPGETGRMQRL